MDNEMTAHSTLTFTSWILVQLLSAPQAMYLPMLPEDEQDNNEPLRVLADTLGEPIHDPHFAMRTALLNFRLCTSFNLFEDDLGFWVKPCSTTWFSRFLLNEYDDTRWIQMFHMTKPTVFALVDLLRPHVQKKDTKYKLAISVVIHVACCLFKLTHGASLFIYSEMFAIGKSTVFAILRHVVHAINDTMRHELKWPTSDRLHHTQQNFLNLCGLPAVVGAIDGTHVSISKPKYVPADYFYFKSGGYNINCQAVVDSDKRFLDLYLGMPGSTNDSRMLRRSSLYDLAMHNNLLDNQGAVHGFSPYLLGDLGYPILPWLMVPHRNTRRLSIAETLFNRKLRRGRCVVENAFGILKQTFRELLNKFELHVAFLPDVIVACAILHNILLRQSHEDVENLIQVLRTEGLDGEVVDDDAEPNVVGPEDGGEGMPEPATVAIGREKRNALGQYLTMQRQYDV